MTWTFNTHIPSLTKFVGSTGSGEDFEESLPYDPDAVNKVLSPTEAPPKFGFDWLSGFGEGV